MVICEPLFLDCRGNFDLIAEFINSALTLIFIFKSLRNCWMLHTERSENDSELEDSRRSKLRINIMCGIFLVFLLGEILYSISSYFIFFSENGQSLLGGSQQIASIGYKIVQILVVNILNCLIVMVGSLYWSAVRVYLLARNVDLENQTNTQRFYKKSFRRLFNVLYAGNSICVVVSAIILSLSNGEEDGGDYTLENIINFVFTVASILVFLFTRFICFKVVQRNSQISHSQRRREYFYISLVFLTCFLRILTYWFAILDINLEGIREYDEMCHDIHPWHALYLTGLTILVNLCPAIIFTHIFTAARSSTAYSSLRATLTEANYNSQQNSPRLASRI